MRISDWSAGVCSSDLAIGSAAMFTVFTYIAPILTEATGAGTLFVTAILVIYGLGLTAGNWLGGVFADRSIDRTLIVSLAGLAAMPLLFAMTMYSPQIGRAHV